MRRLNYWEVHKNKLPKGLRQRKLNKTAIMMSIMSAQAIAQHSIIVAQTFKTVAEKALAVAQNTIKFAEAITNLHRKEKANRYLIKKANN